MISLAGKAGMSIGFTPCLSRSFDIAPPLDACVCVGGGTTCMLGSTYKF